MAGLLYDLDEGFGPSHSVIVNVKVCGPVNPPYKLR
jgi:hypothetical protein